MKDDIEDSRAPRPGFEPPSSAQQAGILPLDHSAAYAILHVWTLNHKFMQFYAQLKQNLRFTDTTLRKFWPQ